MSRANIACLLAALLLPMAGCAKREPPPPVDPRMAQFATLPDWRGFWTAEGMNADISGYSPGGPSTPIDMKFMGGNAPWKPEQLKKIQDMTPQLMAAVAKGKSTGWGYPMMMQSYAPLEFLITPEETVIMNFYRDVRHVYTDGRPHPKPDDLWPTPWGDSVGHWEGDTLVIDTIAVQRPGILFIPIPFVTEGARYIERLRRVSADRIESEFTIEDPAVLTGPWTFKLAYVRQTGIDRMIHESFDQDRTEVDSQGDLLTIKPPKR